MEDSKSQNRPPPYYDNSAAAVNEGLPSTKTAKMSKEDEFPPPYDPDSFQTHPAVAPLQAQYQLQPYGQQQQLPSNPPYHQLPIQHQNPPQEYGYDQMAFPYVQPQYGQNQTYVGQQMVLPQSQQFPVVQQYQGQQVIYAYAQPPAPLTDPPKDYMGYSIFVTICCCWLIGIFAILKASECRTAVARGDYALAQVKSRQARGRAHLALGLGIAAIVIGVIIAGINIAFSVGRYH